MPARTNGPTVGVAPNKRFELPALDFKFGSLTEGTDIPPPLPSPILEEQPKTPPKEQKKEVANGLKDANGTNGTHAGVSPDSAVTTSTTTGVKRPADDAPVSPTGSNRQGSIRRLFSRNLLNQAYADGDSQGQPSMEARPASRSNYSISDDKRSKRNSGWFRRLRSNDTSVPTSTADKRSSRIIEEPKKAAGPPPPMIPELSAWSKVDINDDGSLGGDLFKDIK